MDTKILTSVGIDIGTSTTQLVFSALKLVNRAGPTQVPRFEFSERKILYKSPVVFTPIDKNAVVDQKALLELINSWFDEAGLKFSDIETGAIIITGESLKAKNARETVNDLSFALGDFIVATAGPHLESAIAGQGSGCGAWSKQTGKTALNIDIGGGTANYATFVAGRLTETACLNLGGRLIQFDNNGHISFISQPAKKVIEHIYGRSYDNLNSKQLEETIYKMAETIWDVALGQQSPLADKLLQTNPLSVHRFDKIFISGGVGRCCFERPNNLLKYNDTGPLLAKYLMEIAQAKQLNIKKPAVTVQATVIGAGTWSLSLSGSTVWVDSKELPLKNIPILIPIINWLDETQSLKKAIEKAAKHFDIDLRQEIYGIKLPEGFPLKYTMIQKITSQLIQLWNSYPSAHPAIVVMSENAGKVIGMEAAPQVKGRSLIILDELNVKEGDYIDLGRPLFSSGLLPVTIKSLAFPNS